MPCTCVGDHGGSTDASASLQPGLMRAWATPRPPPALPEPPQGRLPLLTAAISHARDRAPHIHMCIIGAHEAASWPLAAPLAARSVPRAPRAPPTLPLTPLPAPTAGTSVRRPMLGPPGGPPPPARSARSRGGSAVAVLWPVRARRKARSESWATGARDAGRLSVAEKSSQVK